MGNPICQYCSKQMDYIKDHHQIKDSQNWIKYEWFYCYTCHNIVEIGVTMQ
jgi:hypothetical protein